MGVYKPEHAHFPIRWPESIANHGSQRLILMGPAAESTLGSAKMSTTLPGQFPLLVRAALNFAVLLVKATTFLRLLAAAPESSWPSIARLAGGRVVLAADVSQPTP